eukprot:1191976-Prorocentrum_minimum.AAC.2
MTLRGASCRRYAVVVLVFVQLRQRQTLSIGHISPILRKTSQLEIAELVRNRLHVLKVRMPTHALRASSLFRALITLLMPSFGSVHPPRSNSFAQRTRGSAPDISRADGAGSAMTAIAATATATRAR